ncbi:hypothetical protein G7085_11985 [Tessaracoccus sp. HDW20]|nr:hypothetical protein [Tessaracoccus coleopterorum]
MPRGDTRTVTVTNPNTIGFNRISLTKRIANLADQVTPGTTFDVAVTCDAPAQGQTVDYSKTFTFTTPLAGAQETPFLPIGTECSVVETGLPSGSDGLPNASFAWDSTPGYEGLTNGKVTVPQTTTPAPVTVINDIERVYGPLFVTKTVSVPSGVSVSQPFTGTWSCTFGDEIVASGTWQAPTAGGQATLTPSHSKILVGSLCSVTENDPANPVSGDASYHWAVSTRVRRSSSPPTASPPRSATPSTAPPARSR